MLTLTLNPNQIENAYLFGQSYPDIVLYLRRHSGP